MFYGDFYGIPHNNIEPMKDLKTLIELRKEKAYGEEHDYFDNQNFIGFTREGDFEHLQSGLAVVIEKYIDSLGNCTEEVIIDNEGYGIFKVKGKSTSVWVEG